MPLPLAHAALLLGSVGLWAPASLAAQAAVADPAAPPMRVLWFHADHAGNGLDITGFVRRIRARPGPLPGFIRVTAPRADGAGAAVACLRSRDLRQAGSRGGTFHVRLADAGPAGQVTVTYAATCP
mgnify:CR=1 FL=1